MSWNNQYTKFWFEKEDEKKEGKTTIEISQSNLIKFVEELGYRKLKFKSDYRLIKIENGNIIDLAFDYMISEEIRMHIGDNFDLYAVWEKFLIKNRLQKYIINTIQSIEIETPTGDIKTSYLYYSNGILEIKPNEILLIDYKDFKGYIWKRQINQRDAIKNDYLGCDFYQFCQRLCNDDKEKFDNLRSIIGYLLHSYKDKTITRAVILLDDEVSDSNSIANGGTGKTLLATALGYIIPTNFKSGKQKESSSNRFYFADIEPSDKLIIFDDVLPEFEFESLFSMITGDMPIEKKYQNPITIPFKHSPKVVISSNYIIQSYGNSANRRKIEFEVSSYFREVKTPEEEFGRRMFDDWDSIEWNKFDNFMIDCVQYYLVNGIKDKKSPNLERNRIVQATDRDFVNVMENALKYPTEYGGICRGKDFHYNKKKLFEIYKQESGEWGTRNITPAEFKKWLDIFCIQKKLNFEQKKSNSEYLLIIYNSNLSE